MQKSIADKVRAAIRGFMRSPEYSAATAKSRARIFAEEFEPKLARVGWFDWLERLMRAEERREAAAAEADREEPQMRLLGPGFAELFTSLNQRLQLQNGKKKAIDLMTAPQLRESAAALRANAARRLTEAKEKDRLQAKYLIGIAHEMDPFVKFDPFLTVREFRELKAAGVEAGAKAKAAQ